MPTLANKAVGGIRRLLKLQEPERAERLPTDTGLHFRRVGEFAWNVGKMVNISRSGVLFSAGKMVDADTSIEMEFVQPRALGGRAGELVHCRGKIVRTILPPASDSRPAFAAKFSGYHVIGGQNDW